MEGMIRIKLNPWYESDYLTFVVASYLDEVSILRFMQTNRNNNMMFNADPVWQTRYNQEFKRVKVIEDLYGNAEEEKKGRARTAYIASKKACTDPQNMAFKPEDENKFTVMQVGYLGQLKKSDPISMVYGEHYDVISFFSCHFVF